MSEPKQHNPNSLTDEQIGTADGWRLLDKDEVLLGVTLASEGDSAKRAALEMWDYDEWRPGPFFGGNLRLPYRTNLTRAELRKARGLPDEPAKTPEATAAQDAELYEVQSKYAKAALKALEDRRRIAHLEQLVSDQSDETSKARLEVETLMRACDAWQAQGESKDAEIARLKEDLAELSNEASLRDQLQRARQSAKNSKDNFRSVQKERDALAAELARAKALPEMAGLGTPWPVWDVLAKLCDATRHLLDDHDCDGHGHEGFREAQLVAERMIKPLTSAILTICPPPATRRHPNQAGCVPGEI